MLFRQLFDQVSSTYTYLFAADVGKPAVIIDPVREQIELYQQLLRELNLSLQYSIDTHTHADHITAGDKLREFCNCQIVVGQESKATNADRRVKDSEKISVGELTLTALHTPGHTDDCYSYFIDDRIFTGDTLFIRGTGRTDFQSGSAEQQYHSIFEKIFKLPDQTLVFPGHDYRGMTVSTIAEEKRFNPRLQVKNMTEYCAIMDNLKLAPPKLIDIAVPANLRCGAEG